MMSNQGRKPNHSYNPPISAEDWMEEAECRSFPTAWFFPVHSTNKNRAEEYRHYAKAVAICHVCPVKETCLEYALARPSTEGIWGGTSQRERIALRKRRRMSDD